jgi:hypothetical protein
MTEYRIEFKVGPRKSGVDECDQGWEPVRVDPTIDYRDLGRVVKEADAMDAAWDYAYTHRVVEVEVGQVDRYDVVAKCWRRCEVYMSTPKQVA